MASTAVTLDEMTEKRILFFSGKAREVRIMRMESPNPFETIYHNANWVLIESSQEFYQAIILAVLRMLKLGEHMQILQHQGKPPVGTAESSVREIIQKLRIGGDGPEIAITCDMICKLGIWCEARVVVNAQNPIGERKFRCEQIFGDFGAQVKVEDCTPR